MIFNPLVSLFDTLVDDRQRFRRGSPGAGVVRIVDRRAFRRADRVVADTDAHAEFFRDEFGLAAGPGRGVLRRRRGQALPARLAAGGPVPRALRRQADPPPRSRDDPRCCRARAGDSVPRRRQRPARASPRRPARERRLGPVGRLRRPAERDPGGRLCTRHLRNDGQGRAGDSQQGLPGDRLRDAAHHRRHARRTGAADRRPTTRCSCHPATRPRSPRRCVGWPPTAGSPTRSARPAARRTRRARARPHSAPAGARCSSGRSRARDPAARASLPRGVRVRRRDVGARGAPAARRSRRGASTSAT